MDGIQPRPDWMHPLPQDPPSVADALQACVDAYRHHNAPTHLCRQCLSEEMEQVILAGARQAQQGQCPKPESFGQIYFEHPNCVGGEDTLKLFLPYGLQTMLTGTPPPGFGKHSYPDVLETTLKAGFWYWSPELTAPVRALAARLFHDWFNTGTFELEGWPHSDVPADDLTGAGDDILQLCAMTLIDPADLIERLSGLHTPWSDEVFSAAGHFVMEEPFYLSVETGTKEPRYKPACDAIAASLASREARAFQHLITPDWLRAAFFRRSEDHPELAATLSKFETCYQVQMVQTVETAKLDILDEWPELPAISS